MWEERNRRLDFQQFIEKPFSDCFGRVPEDMDEYGYLNVDGVGDLFIVERDVGLVKAIFMPATITPMEGEGLGNNRWPFLFETGYEGEDTFEVVYGGTSSPYSKLAFFEGPDKAEGSCMKVLKLKRLLELPGRKLCKDKNVVAEALQLHQIPREITYADIWAMVGELVVRAEHWKNQRKLEETKNPWDLIRASD